MEYINEKTAYTKRTIRKNHSTASMTGVSMPKRGIMQNGTFLPTEYATDPKKRDEVLHIISKLPENQRLALVAHFYGGLSVPETAMTMKISTQATAGYLNSACESVLKELGMADMCMTASGEPADASVLKEIFNWYETETITDERIQRVLEPVLKMIREKKFERSRWSWLIRPMLSVAMVITLIITVAVLKTDTGQNSNSVVPISQAPIAVMTMDYHKLSGKVLLQNKGYGGLEIALVDAQSGETIGTTTSNADGTYTISEIAGGRYKLRVTLPKGMALVDGDTDGNVMINKQSELVIGKDTKNDIESVDIQVWLTD